MVSRLPWPFTHSSAGTFVTDAIDDLALETGCMLAMTESQDNAFVGIVNLRIPALEHRSELLIQGFHPRL